MAKTLALIEHIHEMHLAHHELETYFMIIIMCITVVLDKMQKRSAVLTARLASGGAFLFSSSYIRMDSSKA